MSARKYSTPSYRYSFNTQEKIEELGEGHTTALYWEYDGKLGRRWNLDPLGQFVSNQYMAFANNPIYLTDPDGGWIPVVEKDVTTTTTTVGSTTTTTTTTTGYLAAEKEEGDNAETLAAFLDIDKETATKMFDQMTKANDCSVKIPESVAGAINKQIQHAIDYPDNYGGLFDENYNCWNSAISTSQNEMPKTYGITQDNVYLNSGKNFTATLIDEYKYTNVSEKPNEIKFGKTVLRLAENTTDIFGDPSGNVTTHGCIYLGKSKNGTEYVWTKNGWSNAPMVSKLSEVLSVYSGSFVQGGGTKKNEGGYYNWTGN